MRHTAAVALTLAILAVTGGQALLAQARRGGASGPRASDPRETGGTASVVGRVLDAGTDVPVRRAEVVAVRTTNNEPSALGRVTTITDDEGRYRLDRLAPGAWRVTASKGGYFTWQFGQRRPFEDPEPITLAREQQFNADIPMTRGGAISGRVADEFGQPVAGLQVRVYRARMEQGYRRLQAVGAPDLTDDTGTFRVYGLPPGDYYVGASLRVAPVDSVVETTYAPTYFPGTGDLANAQRIRLTLGAEANAIFSLLPVRRVRVSGVVMTSAGTPANAFLNLTSEATELGMPLGVGGVTRPDGTFTLTDVSPGRYILSASLRGDGPDESASLPITVEADDVSGATLVTGRPATIRGTVVADAGVSRRLPSNLSVTASSARAGGTVLGSDSGVSFTIDSLSEPFRLSVDNLSADWAVKDITVNGVSAIDSPAELGPGQEAEAQIVLTDRVTEVSGTVSATEARGVTVVVFSADTTKWSGRSRYVRVGQPDERGRFHIAGLPSGHEYLAVATDHLEDGEHYDPEFLAGIRDVSVPFFLDEGGKAMLEVRLVER